MNADEAIEMLDCSQTYPNLVSQIVPAPHTYQLIKRLRD
ncbi:MAG: hypothetical protein Ct9H90mP2_11730 [Dehalococcoidia bacterium]|nr:MAG: hypothetical protein Ct9H90mP2_11730 [Dehalococcoidia bacterium]